MLKEKLEKKQSNSFCSIDDLDLTPEIEVINGNKTARDKTGSNQLALDDASLNNSLNTFINMLSLKDNNKKNESINKENEERFSKKILFKKTHFSAQQTSGNFIISKSITNNKYISPNIKTKFKGIFIQNINPLPQFKSRLNSSSSMKNIIEDFNRSRKTTAKKNEILDLLNSPIHQKKERLFPANSKNKVAQIQKMINKVFDGRPSVRKLNSHRSCKDLNMIKKEEERFEVDLFQRQFNKKRISQEKSKIFTINTSHNLLSYDISTNVFYHRKKNSCL